MFYNIKWFIKKYYEKFRRIFVYIPVLWKDNEWDYGYLLELEQFKLKQMCRWYENNDYGVSITGKDVYNEMKLAISLLDIILDKEDWWTITDRKRISEDGEYIPTPNEDYILKKYVNIGNYKRFIPYVTDMSMRNCPNLWKTELRPMKAWYLYHRLRKERMQEWWD